LRATLEDIEEGKFKELTISENPEDPMYVDRSRKSGTVKWFRGDGTGYIIPDEDPEKTIYMDKSVVHGDWKKLRRGTRVKYVPTDMMGREIAIDVWPTETVRYLKPSLAESFWARVGKAIEKRGEKKAERQKEDEKTALNIGHEILSILHPKAKQTDVDESPDKERLTWTWEWNPGLEDGDIFEFRLTWTIDSGHVTLGMYLGNPNGIELMDLVDIIVVGYLSQRIRLKAFGKDKLARILRTGERDR
jgi:cold shock CspA family protein